MSQHADENGAVDLQIARQQGYEAGLTKGLEVVANGSQADRIEDFIVRKNEELRAENKRLIERLAYLEKEVILFHTYANTPAPQTAEKALLLGDQKWLEQGKALKAAEAELELLRQQNKALTVQMRQALTVVEAAREWVNSMAPTDAEIRQGLDGMLDFTKRNRATMQRLFSALHACTLGEMVETGGE